MDCCTKHPSPVFSRCIKAANNPMSKCIPVLLSPKAAPDWVGMSYSPLYHPVVAAAPPAHCATGSKALTLANGESSLKPLMVP